jgi:hypothetical protein
VAQDREKRRKALTPTRSNTPPALKGYGSSYASRLVQRTFFGNVIDEPPTGPVTHATTGVLTGQGSAVVGSAARVGSGVTHDTSGALTGQGSTLAGSATRFRAHPTTGVLTGPGSTVVGAASSATNRPSSGALIGPGSTVAGSATRFRALATSGDLIGPGSTLSGSAARSAGAVTHATDGALVGPGSTLSGSAARFRAFASSGVLVGPGSAVAGSAVRSGPPVMITDIQAGLIYQIALLHGLDPSNPLTVSPTARSAGTLSQTVSGTSTVTISTTSAPPLSGSAGDWIDALAALHGLTSDLVVTATTRDSGSVSQTLSVTGDTTTVTTV